MTDGDKTRLIDAACIARQKAYAPFSKFLVGAAILSAEGDIVSGCNVENVSYGLTTCAERVAVGAAVAGGRRNFTAIAIASSTGCQPCGACLQVLAEFCADLPIYLVAVDVGNRIIETSLAQLLPQRFHL